MNKRSAAKAVSWEGLSNLVCLGLAYIMFGNFGDCLAFTAICIALKAVGYYWHERFWEG